MNNFLRCNLLFFSLLSMSVTAATQLQDPTKPPQAAISVQSKDSVTQQASQLRLESVLRKNGELSALISGKLVRQGDSLEGYRIKRIELGRVTLVRGNEELKLDLYKYENIRREN